MCEYYISLINSYLGTNDFIINHPIKYANAQIQKMMKYPLSIPENPKNWRLVFSEKSNNAPEPLLIKKAPTPPAIPPIGKHIADGGEYIGGP